MKTIEKAQNSILADIPKENWPIVDVRQKLFRAFSGENFAKEVEIIRQEAIKKYGEVLYDTFRFQIQNGYLSQGNFEILIQDYVAKIVSHRITPDVKLLIAAHGGQLVKEETKPKSRKGKKEVTK